MATTTTSTVAVNISGAIAAQLQLLAQTDLVHAIYARVEKVASNSGKQVTFRLNTKFSNATSALTEATDPSSTTLGVTDTALAAAQYGMFFEVSDLLIATDPWPVIESFVPLLAVNAAETMDKLCQAVLVAGTNVRYANNVAARANVAQSATVADWRSVAAGLASRGAHKIAQGVGASVGINTYPVPNSYIAAVHPDVAADVTALTGFVPAHQYANASGLLPGEVGMIQTIPIRFVASRNADDGTGQTGAAGTATYKDNGANFYVYLNPVFGAEAFGWAQWGSGVEFTSDKGTTALGLTQRYGWKTIGKAGRLNENFLTRVECAASE